MEFALVIHELSIFKVCGIIGISKIEFLNFTGKERIEQNQKILKATENILGL